MNIFVCAFLESYFIGPPSLMLIRRMRVFIVVLETAILTIDLYSVVVGRFRNTQSGKLHVTISIAQFPLRYVTCRCS